MSETNSQCFYKIEDAMSFINYLLSLNLNEDGDSYNDIHLYTEEQLIIVEWVQVFYEGSSDYGRFQYVSPDQTVMIEEAFPDGHLEMCYSEDDYDERLSDWLKENPGWEQTEYGAWFNKTEAAHQKE